jgi:hypothetical protein
MALLKEEKDDVSIGLFVADRIKAMEYNKAATILCAFPNTHLKVKRPGERQTALTTIQAHPSILNKLEKIMSLSSFKTMLEHTPELQSLLRSKKPKRSHGPFFQVPSLPMQISNEPPSKQSMVLKTNSI